MADAELVERLQQGSEVWNTWQKQHMDVLLDLRGADLRGTDLSRSRLIRADLRGADLRGANLRSTDLIRAELSRARLNNADLHGADVRGANLHNANLNGANLRNANLNGASLKDVNLHNASLINTYLKHVDLSGARLGETVFAYLDLRRTKGLLALVHQGPSRIELYTVQLPQNGVTSHFLRGAGVPNEWIEGYRAHMMNPIQYHSLFISYSSQDDLLARRLHADLQDHGVRCWFAPDDMKIGDKIRSRIDEAIHVHEKLLLLLSEHALISNWVEDEVEAAIEKERRQQREVLFPVRLDESVMQTTQAWAAKLRRTRHIGDFTHWTDPQAYQQAFDRLLRDLKKTDEQQDQETNP